MWYQVLLEHPEVSQSNKENQHSAAVEVGGGVISHLTAHLSEWNIKKRGGRKTTPKSLSVARGHTWPLTALCHHQVNDLRFEFDQTLITQTVCVWGGGGMHHNMFPWQHTWTNKKGGNHGDHCTATEEDGMGPTVLCRQTPCVTG